MTDLTALPALLARVEAATGGDRELDRDLMLAIGGAREIDDTLFYGPNEAAWCFGEFEDDSSLPPLPYLTTSLDATVALVEKLRPGAAWEARGVRGRGISAGAGSVGRADGVASTPPLALLAALLRSMIEEEGR